MTRCHAKRFGQTATIPHHDVLNGHLLSLVAAMHVLAVAAVTADGEIYWLLVARARHGVQLQV